MIELSKKAKKVAKCHFKGKKIKGLLKVKRLFKGKKVKR